VQGTGNEGIVGDLPQHFGISALIFLLFYGYLITIGEFHPKPRKPLNKPESLWGLFYTIILLPLVMGFLFLSGNKRPQDA
jgi:hypothetical protein